MSRRAVPSAVSEWARSARKAAGYTSTDKAAAALGGEFDGSYLRSLEAGYIGRPSPERLAVLERLYASKAPEPEAESPAGLDSVITALDRIALELRRLREVQQGLADGLGLAIGAQLPGVVDTLLRQEVRNESDTE